MLYDLRHGDTRVRLLVTLLLCTLGVSYLFGAWMVGLYAGFSTRSVATTYADRDMTMTPESTVVVHHDVSATEIADEPHHVDMELLVQDTHVHMPMYGLIAATLALIALGLAIPRWAGYGLIALLFAAPWLDFAGMWLTKLVAPGFAIMTVAGGWAMGFGYTIVAAIALWQMWGPRKERVV